MLRGDFYMTGSGPAVISPSAYEERPESEQIDTRFGRVTVYPKQPVIFPTGMLGMPDKMQFCLTNFPSEKMSRFKLLQSLEDHQLSFITLPLGLKNPIIDRADMEMAARDLNIPLEHIAALLIVSVHREDGVVKLSANTRAPIIMHALKRTATQYVFHSSRYQIRQALTI